VYGSFEPDQLLSMGRLLDAGDGILDAGANMGFMTCDAARYVGQSGHVAAVEPEAARLGRLIVSVALNGLGNVTAPREGAGSIRMTVPSSTGGIGSGGVRRRRLRGRSHARRWRSTGLMTCSPARAPTGPLCDVGCGRPRI
jgi:hypothetical protein